MFGLLMQHLQRLLQRSIFLFLPVQGEELEGCERGERRRLLSRELSWISDKYVEDSSAQKLMGERKVKFV